MPPMRAPRNALGLFCLLACGAALSRDAAAARTPGPRSTRRPRRGRASRRRRRATSRRPRPDAERAGRRSRRSAADREDQPRRRKPSTRANRYPFLVAEKDTRKAGRARRSPTPKWRSTTRRRRARRSETGERARRSNSSPRSGRSRRGSNRWRPKPAFQGKTTTEDPDVANVVYSADIDFPSPANTGRWR